MICNQHILQNGVLRHLSSGETLVRSPVFPTIQVSLSEGRTLGHCHQSLVIRKQRLFEAVQVEVGTLGQLLLYIQEAITLVFIFLLIP